MFSWFEQRIDSFKVPTQLQPPTHLLGFCWHYLRQIWPWVTILFTLAGLNAFLELIVLGYSAEIIDMFGTTAPHAFFQEHSGRLLLMGAVLLLARPLLLVLHGFLFFQTITVNIQNLLRWQNHLHLSQQRLSFFYDHFSGALANRVVYVGAALKECLLAAAIAVWPLIIYVSTALFLLWQADGRLILPLLFIIGAYLGIIFKFMPLSMAKAEIMATSRSELLGKLTDNYTNILSVRLFSNRHREDYYLRESLRKHRMNIAYDCRIVAVMEIAVNILNCLLLASTMGCAIFLWTQQQISVGAMVLSFAIATRFYHLSIWTMYMMGHFLENLATIREALPFLSAPLRLEDKNPVPLCVGEGCITFDHVSFRYEEKSVTGLLQEGPKLAVIDDLNLHIRGGERVGLVGRSGSGKTTLIHLLLRFYEVQSGTIRLDHQNILDVTQESLRSSIGLVTQDVQLFNRSIRDNVLYARPDASEVELQAVLQQAQAHVFVKHLVDSKGRRGVEAHIGERGIKLSGGQRQRLGIARVLLKNAPILILDEATSALDSESEAYIQEELEALMAEKTVLAIAHRLSTIVRMDRLIVLDQGKILEQGTHTELLAKKGFYAQLWQRQCSGFLREA